MFEPYFHSFFFFVWQIFESSSPTEFIYTAFRVKVDELGLVTITTAHLSVGFFSFLQNPFEFDEFGKSVCLSFQFHTIIYSFIRRPLEHDSKRIKKSILSKKKLSFTLQFGRCMRCNFHTSFLMKNLTAFVCMHNKRSYSFVWTKINIFEKCMSKCKIQQIFLFSKKSSHYLFSREKQTHFLAQ